MTDIPKLIELAKRLREGRSENPTEMIVTQYGATTQLQIDAAEAILALIDQLEKAQFKIIDLQNLLHETRDVHHFELNEKLATARNDALANLQVTDEMTEAGADAADGFFNIDGDDKGAWLSSNGYAAAFKAMLEVAIKTPAPVPPAKEEK